MGYLLVMLWPYALLAFLIGLVVAWFSCEAERDEG